MKKPYHIAKRPFEGYWSILSDLINKDEVVAHVLDPDFGEVIVEALNLRESAKALAQMVHDINPKHLEVGAGYMAQMKSLAKGVTLP